MGVNRHQRRLKKAENTIVNELSHLKEPPGKLTEIKIVHENDTSFLKLSV